MNRAIIPRKEQLVPLIRGWYCRESAECDVSRLQPVDDLCFAGGRRYDLSIAKTLAANGLMSIRGWLEMHTDAMGNERDASNHDPGR